MEKPPKKMFKAPILFQGPKEGNAVTLESNAQTLRRSDLKNRDHIKGLDLSGS